MMSGEESREDADPLDVNELLRKAKRLKSLSTPPEARERLAWRVGYVAGRIEVVKPKKDGRNSIAVLLAAASFLTLGVMSVFSSTSIVTRNAFSAHPEKQIEMARPGYSALSDVAGGARIQGPQGFQRPRTDEGLDAGAPIAVAAPPEIPKAEGSDARRRLADVVTSDSPKQTKIPPRVVCTGVGVFERCKKVMVTEEAKSPELSPPPASSVPEQECTGVGIFRRCKQVSGKEKKTKSEPRPGSSNAPTAAQDIGCVGAGLFKKCDPNGEKQKIAAPKPANTARYKVVCTGVGVFERCRKVEVSESNELLADD
jgi:hypothetical protein